MTHISYLSISHRISWVCFKKVGKSWESYGYDVSTWISVCAVKLAVKAVTDITGGEKLIHNGITKMAVCHFKMKGNLGVATNRWAWKVSGCPGCFGWKTKNLVNLNQTKKPDSRLSNEDMAFLAFSAFFSENSPSGWVPCPLSVKRKVATCPSSDNLVDVTK